LFRGGRAPVPIDVIVRHRAGAVEAEYLGEPRPQGLAGRLLAPEGGVVSHVDRFVAPSLAQVEYRLGANHLVVTTAFTPVGDHETAGHSAITFKLRVATPLVRAAVGPVAQRILAQDAMILEGQSATIRAFGGEQFASTRLDTLGSHIGRMLRRLERGQAGEGDDGDPPQESRFTIRV
ncbi:MAG: aromatic ring-hydroxylating oxygenase subunit alpha, partial [Acidimicrobiales bacterium]